VGPLKDLQGLMCLADALVEGQQCTLKAVFSRAFSRAAHLLLLLHADWSLQQLLFELAFLDFLRLLSAPVQSLRFFLLAPPPRRE